jgi:hypothetical protein
MQTVRSLDLDVIAPEPSAFHSSALSLAPLGRITALLLSAGRGLMQPYYSIVSLTFN